MCGRFVSTSSPEKIARFFDVEATDEKLLDRGPNYNTAPTSSVLVVYEDGTTRNLDAFRWGLVPFWAKDLSIGSRMINARAETVATKPSFRKAFANKRCIIPADGFYEWTKEPGQKKKQPFYIHGVDGEPLAFAGLWERWKPRGKENGKSDHGDDNPDPTPELLEDQEPVRTCSIITTEANSKMRELHDRMPVILPRSEWDQWLSSDEHDTDSLGKLLVPAPSELITFHAVSTEVNNARNRGEHLIDEADPMTGELFG